MRPLSNAPWSFPCRGVQGGLFRSASVLPEPWSNAMGRVVARWPACRVLVDGSLLGDAAGALCHHHDRQALGSAKG